MKRLIFPVILILSMTLISNKSFSHCEVPCGIYNDEMRILLMQEHFMTIEKAMINIQELSEEANPNYNQIVRWINTKEHHANEIQHIAEQYFLTQRIKIAEDSDTVAFAKYQNELTMLHKIIVLSMKAKQSTDVEHVKILTKTLKQFEQSYFEGKHRHKVGIEHH